MMLKVDDIEFSYNSTPVLKKVEFEVEKGEVAAILGPNGAGKSTLLKCMNGILKPRKGMVMVEDLPVKSLRIREMAKKIGYVPQSSNGNFMTIFDAVLLGRKPYIKWGADEKDFKLVEDTLKLMGLEKLALMRTNELSGGELQKVVLARALVQKPKIFFLDEPTNNLDMKNQLEVMRIISKVTHERGVTSIIVMHEINLALRYSDKFIVMKDGMIYAQGRKIIKPQLIKEVYGIEALVENVRGFPLVIPIEA
jgi:iron complex transport system ATP-binding protein